MARLEQVTDLYKNNLNTLEAGPRIGSESQVQKVGSITY